MLRTLLIFLLLLLFNHKANAKYSLDEKVDLLYEVVTAGNSEAMKLELKIFVKQLHKYDKLSPKKRVKKIFSETKKKYLHTYYLYSFFPDLLTLKTYNCVTGSALYAVIFDELDIPYNVVEVPQHVYLIAYPNTAQIGVESTDAKDGVYNWTEYNKLDAVNFLLQIGEISQNEIQLKGMDAIVEEFFYSNSEHDFDGLVGMHFFNRALFFNEQKDFDKALYYLDKAGDHYESEKVAYMEGAILSSLIGDTEYDNIKIVSYLCRYYNVVGKKAQKQRVEGTFSYVMSEALNTRHDEEFIDTSLIIINDNLDEEEDRNKLTSFIYETRSVYHYNRGQYKLALDYSEKGYALNPENKGFEDLIASMLVNTLIEDDDIEDDEELFEQVNSYQEKYEFLDESPKFLTFLVTYYSFAVYDAFLYGDTELGFIYLEKLMSYVDNPDIDKEITNELIGDAYGSISSYYFRQEEYDTALTWINNALEYDPESASLLRKKEYILGKM